MKAHSSHPLIEDLLAQSDWVWRLARSLVRDDHQADDIVQDTWVAALRHPSIHAGSRAARSAWLAKVVRHAAARLARSKDRREGRELASARPEEVEAADRLFDREGERRKLVEAVLSLNAPYRTVLILRYFDNLSPREVAHRLGENRSTVRNRIHRGLELLRARLARDYGADQPWLMALVPLAHKSAVGNATVTGIAIMSTKTIAALASGVLLLAVGWWAWPREGEPNERVVDSAPVSSEAVAMPTGATEPGRLIEGQASNGREVVQWIEESAPVASALGAIVGVVRVDGGPPRESISLRLVAAEDASFQDEQRVAATPDGRFMFEGLPADFRGHIEVPRRYSVANSDPRIRSIPIDAPQEDLVLDLERTPCLTGRLVSRQDGQPVEDPRLGAYISWVEGGNMMTGAEFEGNGRFFVTLIETKEIASVSLNAWGRGLLGSFKFTREEIPPDLNLGDLALTAGGIAHLVVLDPERIPVAGALVRVQGIGGAPKKTDFEGHATVEGVPPKATIEVLARGFDPRRFSAPISSEPQEVVLERANRLTIRILSPAGDPEPGVRLRVSADGPLFVDSNPTLDRFLIPQVPRGGGRIAGMDDGEFFSMFEADERGLVELQSVLPGLALVLHVEDELDSSAQEQFVAPLRSQESRTLTIRLSRDPNVLQGLVKDQLGQPMERAKVTLLGAAHGMTRMTGADGRFQFDRLYAEEANLRVERRGYVTAWFPHLPIPSAAPLRVVLDPGRDVEVSVVDSRGEPISDGTVVAWLLDESRSWSAKGKNGLFHFQDLPQLELEVRVSLAGTEFRKPLGASVEEFEIQVPTLGRLEVSCEPGPELPQERLGLRLRSLEDESIEQFAFLLPTRSGPAVFESVPPGSYELSFATWKKEGSGTNIIVSLGTSLRVQVVSADTTRVQLR